MRSRGESTPGARHKTSHDTANSEDWLEACPIGVAGRTGCPGSIRRSLLHTESLKLLTRIIDNRRSAHDMSRRIPSVEGREASRRHRNSEEINLLEINRSKTIYWKDAGLGLVSITARLRALRAKTPFGRLASGSICLASGSIMPLMTRNLPCFRLDLPSTSTNDPNRSSVATDRETNRPASL